MRRKATGSCVSWAGRFCDPTACSLVVRHLSLLFFVVCLLHCGAFILHTRVLCAAMPQACVYVAGHCLDGNSFLHLCHLWCASCLGCEAAFLRTTKLSHVLSRVFAHWQTFFYILVVCSVAPLQKSCFFAQQGNRQLRIAGCFRAVALVLCFQFLLQCNPQ